MQREGFAAAAYLQAAFFDGKVPTKKDISMMKKKTMKRGGVQPDFFERKFYVDVLNGMKLFKGEMGVQVEGCTAIRSMIVGQDARKKAVVKSGVVIIVGEALRRFDQEPALIEAACALLSSLATVRDSHSDMLKTRVYETIIKALKYYSDSEDEQLQYHGIMALHNLSVGDKAASRALRNAKALEAGVRARSYFPENEILVKKANDMTRLILRGGKF